MSSGSNRTIKEAKVVRLSAEDQRACAEAMTNPPPPSGALLRAAKARRALIKTAD